MLFINAINPARLSIPSSHCPHTHTDHPLLSTRASWKSCSIINTYSSINIIFWTLARRLVRCLEFRHSIAPLQISIGWILFDLT
ncbi:hypothetical protein LINGRAHAP2_LOCUS6719, partial [Linum grandiflorum]